PGSAGSLGASKNLVIATTAPVVTSVSAALADGSYGVGTLVPLTVQFNTAVLVSGVPSLALNSGGTAFYSSGSGSSVLTFSYVVAAGENSGHLDYTSSLALSLNGGSIRDLATNAASTTLAPPGTAGSLGANKNIVITTAAALMVTSV